MDQPQSHYADSQRFFNQPYAPDLENSSLPGGFGRSPPPLDLAALVGLASSYQLGANELLNILEILGHGTLITRGQLSAADIASIDNIILSLGIEKRESDTAKNHQSIGQRSKALKGGATLVAFPQFLEIVKKKLAEDKTPIRIQLQGTASRGAFVALIKSAASYEDKHSVVSIISSMEEQLALHEALETHSTKLMECLRESNAATLVFSGSARYFLTPQSALEYFDFQLPQAVLENPLLRMVLSQRLPEGNPFLIIQEPHHFVSAQRSLYQGLAALYKVNRHWFGKNTVFVMEGVERGHEVALDPLRALSVAPTEVTIQQALESLLIPGHLAFLWAHNPPIRALGGEDPVLYHASARLSKKMDDFAAMLRGTEKGDVLKIAAQALFTKTVWHSLVFARNWSMAQEVTRLRAAGMQPILFVGFLHLDVSVWRYHQKQLQELNLSQESLWKAAQANGLLTVEEVEALRQAKGGLLQDLLASSPGPPPTFVDLNYSLTPEREKQFSERYFSLMAAQAAGARAINDYINQLIVEAKCSLEANVDSGGCRNTTVRPDVAAAAKFIAHMGDLARDNSWGAKLQRWLSKAKNLFRGGVNFAPTEDDSEAKLASFQAICAAFKAVGFRGSGYGPDRDYAPNPDGPRTLDQAIQIAMNAGVAFDPDNYYFRTLPDEKFNEYYGPTMFAAYGPRHATPASKRISWKDLCLPDGRMMVTIRESVLDSDQKILAVFAHECFEVEALRKKLGNRQTITVGELNYLTADGIRNNLHWLAWKKANEMVVKAFEG